MFINQLNKILEGIRGQSGRDPGGNRKGSSAGDTQFPEADKEAWVPPGDRKVIGFVDAGLIEEGVMGTFGGRRILRGRDGVDDAGAAHGVADGEGKFVPTDPAFVTVMEDPGGEGRRGCG